MLESLVGVDVGSYTIDRTNPAAVVVHLNGLPEAIKLDNLLSIFDETTNRAVWVPGWGQPAVLAGTSGAQTITLGATASAVVTGTGDALKIKVSLTSAPVTATAASVTLPQVSVLDCARIGPNDDPASIATTGTGDTAYNIGTPSTTMMLGGTAHQPGRIYTSGRNFMNAGHVMYMNGANTPWFTFNEFGSTGTAGHAVYNHAWWAAEFARLKNRGLNSTRVWIVDDPTNEGVTLNADGSANPVTQLFWDNLNDMLDLARTNGIYIKVSVMSFDCFTWNNAGAERWHYMLGKLSNLQSFITNFIVPLAQISATNPYLYCVDLGNEVDNFYETMETATPRNATCTPVGGSSKVVNFGQRLDDLIVGTQLYINGVSMGLITVRNSDTQCTCQNSYPGVSATFTAGTWGFNGKLPATYQRYIAYASKAIHELAVAPLVTVGVQSIKYSSAIYSASDYYADSVLAGFTGSALSKIDMHSIHYYQWAEAFFPLIVTPSAAGLSVKPATYGELPMAWQNLNGTAFSGQWVFAWRPRLYYSVGAVVYTDDGTNKRLYRCVTPGTAGPTAGVAGGDIGPTGTGSGIADGAAVWNYCPNNSTFEPNSTYTAYRLVISYDGGLWVCSTAGNTANEGGPYGSGPTFTSGGGAVFTYLRPVILDERWLYDWLLNNGWAGHYPWESSNFSVNGGLYEVDYSNQIIANWTGSTTYARDALVINDSGKIYRALSATGTSAGTGGPTGTGTSITDGTVTWAYARTTAGPSTLSPAWTHAGVAIKAFSDANAALVFPDTSAPWDNSGTVVRQSRKRAWYNYGVDTTYTAGALFAAGDASLAQLVGAFDAQDGIFLKAAGSARTLSVGVRSAGSDVSIPRAAWNIDKFDGTGPSGKTLNLANPQVVVINSGWQHGGRNLVGFLVDGQTYWAHEIKVGNEVLALPSNPSLPVRWELNAPSTLAASLSMVALTGGATQLLLPGHAGRRTRSNGRNSQLFQTQIQTISEVLALRVSSLFNRYGTLRPTRISFVETTRYTYDIFEWRLVLNATVTAPGAWLPGQSGGLAEVNTTRAVDTNSGIILASGSGFGQTDVRLVGLEELTTDASGAGDTVSLQLWNATGQQLYYFCELDWEEIQ